MVRNAQPGKNVGDYYFGFGTNADAAGGVEFWFIRLERFAFVFLFLPGGGVLFVCKGCGGDEGAA